ncbi:hypothetical protein EON65_33485, partial [archaeon]
MKVSNTHSTLKFCHTNASAILGNHWDDVISKYKEVDSALYKQPDSVQAILTKVENFIKTRMHVENDDCLKFISPHLIDLAPEGHIGKHLPLP